MTRPFPCSRAGVPAAIPPPCSFLGLPAEGDGPTPGESRAPGREGCPGPVPPNPCGWWGGKSSGAGVVLSLAASCSASLPEGPEQSRSSSTRFPFWKASDASTLLSQPPRFPRDVFHNFPFYPCKAQPDVLSWRRRKSMLEQKCL